MSQWTHILGVIRFDSWSCTSYPAPVEKDANLKFEMDVINSSLNLVKVYGSEGPVEAHVIKTERGPTAVITGDLRDFGLEDVEDIIKWLDDAINTIHDTLRHNKSFDIRMTHIRDLSIRVAVESNAVFYLNYDFDRMKVGIAQTNKLDLKKAVGQLLEDVQALVSDNRSC